MTSDQAHLPPPTPNSNSLLSIPILILLIATFLRLFQLPALPPGLNFDEAGNGVAAFDILHGEPKLWWPIGGGKEPLWPYLIALSTTILGNISLALRLPAAFVGILSVAAVYPLMRLLFQRADWQNRHEGQMIALLTMLGLVLSDWHLHFSRLGFRAILLPLLSTFGFYFLWRSLIKYQVLRVKGQVSRITVHPLSLNLILSSLFIALAIYAYLAARLLLLVPLLFFVCHLLITKIRRYLLNRQSESFRIIDNTRHLLLLISMFLFLLLLFLSPLMIHFLINPADFVARLTTVSIFNPASNKGDLIGAAWHTFTLTLGTFIGLTGDANPLVNLPHQPALPIFLAPFFILGLIASLYHSIHPLFPASLPVLSIVEGLPRPLACPEPGRRDPSPHLFLLCWWVVMLLPAILAPEGAPHHLRLIGTIVPAYALTAIGLTLVTNTLITKVSRLTPHASRFTSHVSRAVYLLPATCYLLLASQTCTNYFIHWPTSVDFTLPFDVYAARLANDIAHAPSNTGYVLPMDIRAGAEARHYTLDYLLGHQRPLPYTYLPVDEHNAETLLTQAAIGKDELRIVRWTADKHHEADAKEIVTFLLETNACLMSRESFPVYDVETYALPDNRRADCKLHSSYTDFNLHASSIFDLPLIDRPIDVTFDGLLRLDAAFIQPTVSPGNWLPVALTLAPLAQMDSDYKASLRLIGPTGERVVQKDRLLRHNFHQGTSLWPPETVNEYYLLPVPPETPPGEYIVVVVIYHPDTQAPLVADGLVEVPVGTVRVE